LTDSITVQISGNTKVVCRREGTSVGMMVITILPFTPANISKDEMVLR